MPRILFIFLDGVGIGPDDPARNPFLATELPVLRDLLGGDVPTLSRPTITTDRCRTFPLDARLDVEGVPQSGTGQTALLTGENAPHAFGRHFGPWVPVRLRPMLLERNVLVRAAEMGRSVVFANAYPAGFGQGRRDRRLAAVPLAAREAGLMIRDAVALAQGEAVASGIVNTGWRERLGHTEIPEISAMEAGRNLVRLAGQADLTLFAHYSTDHAGHKGGMPGAREALERVDAFLGGVIETLPGDTTVLLASDHGNIEDVDSGHTRNPVLGLCVSAGPGIDVPAMTSIMDVPDAILGLL